MIYFPSRWTEEEGGHEAELTCPAERLLIGRPPFKPRQKKISPENKMFSSFLLLDVSARSLTCPGVLWFWDKYRSLSADLRSASISLSSNHSCSISLSQVTRRLTPVNKTPRWLRVQVRTACDWTPAEQMGGGGLLPGDQLKRNTKGV